MSEFILLLIGLGLLLIVVAIVLRPKGDGAPRDTTRNMCGGIAPYSPNRHKH